ncbi:MAG: extracellular solute-binding protein [Chloroflexota bacterium]|nr:extracellular solute-binding protein [Chloroflexota bacterium]
MTRDNGLWLLLATLILLPLLVATLSACSPTPTPEETIVITFAYPQYISLFTKTNFQKLTDAFNEANPDVRIQLREIKNSDGTGVEDIGRDIMLDEEWEIDVFISQGGAYARWLAESGRILNLQPLIEADFAWELDDFYPLVLEQFEQGNDLWGIPGEAIPLGIFYNRDLFDQAGVDYPRPDWTRDEFLTTALALRQGLPEKYFSFAGACRAAVPFIYAHGGALVDAESISSPLEEPLPTLDDPLTAEALQWYLDLALVHGVMPTLAQVEAYTLESSPNSQAGVSVSSSGELGAGRRQCLYADATLNLSADYGQAAMWVAPFSGYSSAWEFKWGVVPLPRDAVEAVVMKSYGYYVTAHCKRPQEALRWIDYLTRQRVDIPGFPARRSVAQGTAFRNRLADGIEPEALDAYSSLLETGQAVESWLAPSGGPYYLGEAMLDVYEHGEDVETALRKAQQKISVP